LIKLFSQILSRYRKHKTAKEIKRVHTQEANALKKYFDNGQIPWSDGYAQHKEKSIIESINSGDVLRKFNDKASITKFGYRLDERIVEYPWIFKNIDKKSSRLLDAGSTFNFKFILENPLIKEKEITIFTYAPESPNYNEKRISYVYGDLRELPFKDAYFDIVVSQSTIEHIDMNNSIYGYDIAYNKKKEIKSYEYLLAIREMIRVLQPAGTLLITFPFGKFENHNFFQQLDDEMLKKLLDEFSHQGIFTTNFFKYLPDGWYSCNQSDCKETGSFNPHTNKGKGDDGAAHCRSICCIKFVKKL
jgi:SAM-dependent methyltransferase